MHRVTFVSPFTSGKTGSIVLKLTPGFFQEGSELHVDDLPEVVENLKNWNETSINIAVTGRSGSGKSTLVNTMLGLWPEEEGAAKVGVKETTKKPQRYPHPVYKNFILWDLPGTGTPAFPRHSYLQKIGFEKYDFFFIVSARRFTEDDLWLAKEIQKRDKLFYFIRTRVDEDIRNDRRDHPTSHNEEIMLSQIKAECISQISDIGFEPKVFVLSGVKEYDTQWDFPRLIESLATDITSIKQHSMIMMATANSRAIIERKFTELEGRIMRVAAGSAVVAAIPVPLLSVSVDLALIVNEVLVYVQVMGLDDRNVRKMSERFSVPLPTMQKIVKAAVPSFAGEQLKKYVVNVIARYALGAAIEETSRFIPVIGNTVAAAASYTATSSALEYILSDVKEAALQLLEIRVNSVKSRLEL